jgi:uncharacterized protein YyaL (SSP411 family)
MDYSKLTKQELLDILTNQEVQKDKSGYFERQVEDLQKLVKEKEKAIQDQINARDAAISETMRLQETITEKEGLQKLVEEKERALEDQIKARDSAISDVIRLQETITEKEYVIKTNAEQKINQEKSYKFLEEKFNELAKLFEEYMTAFKDQIKLSEVMYKNSNYVLQALEIKIKKFNGSDSE